MMSTHLHPFRLRAWCCWLSAALFVVMAFYGMARADDDPLGLGSNGVLKARAMLAPRAGAPVPGGLVTVQVTLTLKEGWHIYANPASDETVRPTVVGPAPEAPVKLIAVDYPPGIPSPQPGSDLPVMVYEPEATITVRLQLDEKVPVGPIELPLLVRYQPCNDRACLAPAKLTVPVRFMVRRP